MKRAANILAGIMIASSLVYPAETVEKVFSGVSELKLEEVSGDLTVKGADCKDVSVMVEYTCNPVGCYTPSFDLRGKTLYLKGEYENKCKNTDVKWTIEVPVKTKLSLESVSGNVSIQNIVAEVEAGVISGNAELIDIKGKCEAGSVSGNIHLENIQGETALSTVSGNMKVKNCFRINRTNSVSGNIRLENSSIEEAESISGDIDVSKCTEIKKIRTTSGDIEIAESGVIEYNMVSTLSGCVNIIK